MALSEMSHLFGEHLSYLASFNNPLSHAEVDGLESSPSYIHSDTEAKTVTQNLNGKQRNLFLKPEMSITITTWSSHPAILHMAI